MNNQFASKTLKSNLLKAAAVALLAPTALLTACSSPDSATEETALTPDYSTEEASNVTLDEVATDAEDYFGRDVTIRGEIAEIIQDGVFSIDEDVLLSGEDVIVFNFDGAELLPADIPEVQVTGMVTQFIRADIENEYGIALDPERYAGFEGQPTIIAKSIALAPTPGQISEDPIAYYNRPIAVDGEIEEVYEAGGFTLDEEQLFGGEDLVVIPADMTNAIAGERVTVTGILRPYIQAEFERDYELQWDLSLQEKVEAEYENKPVFIADKVYPSAQ